MSFRENDSVEWQYIWQLRRPLQISHRRGGRPAAWGRGSDQVAVTPAPAHTKEPSPPLTSPEKGGRVVRSGGREHTHTLLSRESFSPFVTKFENSSRIPPLLSSKSSARISPNESEFRDSSVFGAAFARSDYFVLCSLNPFPLASASVFGPKFPPTNAPIPPPPDLCTPNWTPTQFVARNRA